MTLGWTSTECEVSFRISQGEFETELRQRASDILSMGRIFERTDYLDGLVYLMSDPSAMMTDSTFRITAREYIDLWGKNEKDLFCYNNIWNILCFFKKFRNIFA